MTEMSSTRRSVIRGSTLGAGVLLALALTGIVNYFGWKYHHRFDWTASQLYSLSDKTAGILETLDRDIDVLIFMEPIGDLAPPVEELLARYAAASPRISVRTVDPVKNRAEAQQIVERYGLARADAVVFDGGDDRRIVEAEDLAEYDYSGMQFGQAPEMTGFKGEQAFTSAILELVQSEKPRILFTTGHGEARLDDLSERGLSRAQDLLGRDNFELEEWLSLGREAVPEGTDLVVVAGPTVGFTAPEVELLSDYLREGGRLLALLDPSLGPDGVLATTGLEDLLASYGVELGDDIVVDPDKGVPFFGAETFFVDSYQPHSITEALSQSRYPVIFPLARSVSAGTADGLIISDLLTSSASGWGERDLARLDAVELGEGDLTGPVALGVAVEAVVDEPAADATDDAVEVDGVVAASEAGARLVVFGDSDFATNGQFENVGNSILLGNALNWLAEREELVAIPPKKPEHVRLSLNQSQLSQLFWLLHGLLPGLAIVAGVAVHLRRRR